MDLVSLQTRLRAEGKLTLQLRVIPKSEKTEWGGALLDGSLKVKVAATPERGKANEALTKFLSGEFGVKREQVEIVAGAGSQNKLVRITRAGR
jgi:hypothetical protein